MDVVFRDNNSLVNFSFNGFACKVAKVDNISQGGKPYLIVSELSLPENVNEETFQSFSNNLLQRIEPDSYQIMYINLSKETRSVLQNLPNIISERREFTSATSPETPS